MAMYTNFEEVNYCVRPHMYNSRDVNIISHGRCLKCSYNALAVYMRRYLASLYNVTEDQVIVWKATEQIPEKVLEDVEIRQYRSMVLELHFRSLDEKRMRRHSFTIPQKDVGK